MDRYTVSFRISGVGLQPDKIIKLLNIAPDMYYVPQTAIYYKNGVYKEHLVSDLGIWSIDCKTPESVPIVDKIESLIKVLYPLKNELFEIKRDGYRMDFFCGYFSYNGQPGISLSNELLVKMGSLGINFDLCFYSLKS